MAGQQITGLCADGIDLLLRHVAGMMSDRRILRGLPQFLHRLGRLRAVGIAVLGQPADKRIHLGIHPSFSALSDAVLLVGVSVGVQLVLA